MKITLETTPESGLFIHDGEHGYLSFCKKIIQFLGLRRNKGVMTVRFKNPKQKGFIKVHLSRNSTNQGYWIWHINDKITNEFGRMFTGAVDQFITNRFGRYTSVTVWVKFGKA